MSTAVSWRASGRQARIWVALVAVVAVIAAPLLTLAPAHAEATGYIGTGENQGLWDSEGGNRTLPLMTKDVTYSGSLTGPQFGVGQTYKWSVVEGNLPDGIILASPEPDQYSQSATFSGTPTAAGPFSFTVLADTGENGFELSFEGEVEDSSAGVAPSWTDQTLPDFQVSVPVDDGVVAEGDPVISYSVSAGELPAGLSLSSASGAITGTPTSAGPFDFDITAANEFGHVTASFAGTVAAAPEIDLTLKFDAGTALSDASSEISASGLKIGSEYTLTMYSSPVILYTGIIGPTGGFTWDVALPADTPVGPHRLLLTGIAPDGSAMSAEAWFTLLANGTIGAISYDGPITLAATGTEIAVPMAIGSGLLVIGGFALMLARRKQPARLH